MSDIKIVKGNYTFKIHDHRHTHCVWLYVPDYQFIANMKLKGSNVIGQGGLKYFRRIGFLYENS